MTTGSRWWFYSRYLFIFTLLGNKSPYLTAYTTPILDVFFFSRKAVYSDVHGSDRTSKLVYNLFKGLANLLYRIIYDPFTRYHGHPSRFSELVFV